MNCLKIFNTNPVQDDFWGNGAVYHGYAGMPDDAGRVYTEAQCEEEARRAENMRLKVARTFYGWWAWDEKTGEWDWDNEIMTAFYRWLGRMKKAGITVALNTGWCCPGDINSSSWNGKSPFTVENDWEQSVKNYGDWVSRTVYELVEKRGFDNVKILVLFTEPQHYSGKPNAPSHTPQMLWLSAAQAAHDALCRDGLRDKVSLMGPNEGSTVTSNMLKFAVENAKFIDIYSSHNYQWVPVPEKSLIKTGRTALALPNLFSRASRPVTLKPHTDYEAVIDILYRSDYEQEGSYIFGAYEYNQSGDIVTGGLLPSLSEGSTVCIRPCDIKGEYKRISIRFNSGDSDRALFGIFSGVKAPAELDGKTPTLCKGEHRQVGIAFVDSMQLYKAGTDTPLIDNGIFEREYDGWLLTPMSGGVQDPYSDWVKWADTATAHINGCENSKPYCFDEYNICYSRDNSRPEMGAELTSAAVALMNSGARLTLLWTLFDQQWPNNHTYNADSFVDGDHRCGLMPNLRFSEVPHPAFYAFSLLSRYVDGKGTKVFKGEAKSGLCTTMSVSPSGEVTIVVVNNKAEAEEFELCFQKPLERTLHRHRFDPEKTVCDRTASPIPCDATFQCVTECLSDSIAPFSVTVYTTHND